MNIPIFLPCLLAFVLMSCAHTPMTYQSVKDKTVMRNPSQCQMVCKQHLEICQKSCRNNCMQCHAYAASTTSASYCHYVYEQRQRGGLVIRRLNSFHDPLQCAKTTCNCSADYQVCKQSCSGSIRKQLLAPPLSW